MFAVEGAGQLRAHVRRQQVTQYGDLFTASLDLADRIFASTHDAHAMALQLRTGFTLCSTCMAGNTNGRHTHVVFEFDEYEDRQVFQNKIMPELAATGTKELLWVGSQAFTLRYE